jgi:hypothetical protein
MGGLPSVDKVHRNVIDCPSSTVVDPTAIRCGVAEGTSILLKKYQILDFFSLDINIHSII